MNASQKPAEPAASDDVYATLRPLRQIAALARRHVQAQKSRFETSRKRREELARRFFEAIGPGKMDGLVDLLAADVAIYCDGGGKASALRHPLLGREHVIRMLSMLGTWLADLAAVERRFAEVNVSLCEPPAAAAGPPNVRT